MRWLMFSAVFAAAFALTAPSALAEDFVFNVPVRIENAPGLNGIPTTVMCSLMARVDGRWVATPTAQQSVTPGPTGFRGTVRLSITLPDGVRRSDVWSYQCQIMLRNARNSAGAVVAVPGANASDSVIGYTAVTGQTVASHTISTQGFFDR